MDDGTHRHHWVLASDSALPMTAEEQRERPYCLKRYAICAGCGEEDEQYERVLSPWMDRARRGTDDIVLRGR